MSLVLLVIILCIPDVILSFFLSVSSPTSQLRPPQPAVYLFLLDVSFGAVESGYLSVVCQTLLDTLDKMPGDARTLIGFLTFDSALHFYNLQEGASRPQMLICSDIEGKLKILHFKLLSAGFISLSKQRHGSFYKYQQIHSGDNFFFFPLFL